MIRSIGRLASAAALAACIAGCGGGGGPSASVPALVPGSSSGAVVYPLSRAGSTFALPPAGAYGGSVSFPAFDVPAGAAIAASASTDPPAGLAPAALRRPAVTGTVNVYYYLTFTTPVTITLPSVPAFSLAIGSSLAAQKADFYYTISAPAADGALASFRTEGPATVTGTTAAFSASAVPLTLRAGTRYLFAFASQARVTARPFVYVANTGADAVDVYSFGESGDVAPDFTLAGPATLLDSPVSLVRDVAGRLYVGNRGPLTDPVSSITVYAGGASGNAAPVRTIAGPLTGLTNLRSIAVDASGKVYAAVLGARRGAGAVLVFPPGAAGNVAPSQTIAGYVYLVEGIAVDAAGEIIVANDYPNPSIEIFAPWANGFDAPIRTVAGSATGLSGPGQLAVDEAARQIFVVDGGISVFPLGADGNVAPVARLTGPNTGLASPSGVALTADALVVSDAGTSSVLEYARGTLGNAAPLREITGPYTGLDQPADVVVMP